MYLQVRTGPIDNSAQPLKSLSYAIAKRYAASAAISRGTADKLWIHWLQSTLNIFYYCYYLQLLIDIYFTTVIEITFFFLMGPADNVSAYVVQE